MLQIALRAALTLAVLTSPVGAAPVPYLQLVSTRYAAGAALPPEAAPPTVDLAWVDRSALPAGCTVRSAAKAASGAVCAVTDRGTFRIADGRAEPLRTPTRLKPLQPEAIPSRIAQVAADRDGHIWMATSFGLAITDGDQWWHRLDNADGVPALRTTCLHLAPNGDVWAGTTQGAWRLRSGRFRAFMGKRWLPGDRVSAIWTDARGRAWVQTDAGVACIEERPMTLREKAAHFNGITQARHNRRGYICECGLKKAGDPSSGVILVAAPNDGLWTAYYVAAMSLRYAATRDPEALKQARQSMRAMLDLERLTGIPGFPARAVITDAEIAAGVLGYRKDARVEFLGASTGEPGGGEMRWFRSPVDSTTWCCGDTSSDEMNGHYLAWYAYWTHVADAAEKAEIAATVRRVTDGILRSDYTLIGHTGRRTRWGVWGPQALNDDPVWAYERGLGSAEMLSYLATAAHITGDERYRAASAELITRHHYLLNALCYRRNSPEAWWSINHSDDQLAYVVYYPLLMLERDPARRRLLTGMVASTWEDAPTGDLKIRQEGASFYNFASGAMTGNPCDVRAGIQNLQEWPWELVDWTVRNSQRADVTLRAHLGGDGRNKREIDRMLPASERAVDRWNSDPWGPDGGSDGVKENCGSAWLLAYWMGVYHGYIDPQQ